MNELTLKQVKYIGRKWAFINTVTGVGVALLMFMVMTSFSVVAEVIKEPILYLGIGTAFLLSFLAGRMIVNQILNKRCYIVGKWILSYFIITFMSVLVPILTAMVYHSKLFEFNHLILAIVYPSGFVIVGAIPIIIFGYVYGRKLEDEVLDIIINKKEPKI